MKKRYMLTLSSGPMNRTKELMKDLKLPPALISSILDEAVGLLEKQLILLKKSGGLSMRDLFSQIGEQLDLLAEEATEISKRRKTRDTNRKKVSSRSPIAQHSNQA